MCLVILLAATTTTGSPCTVRLSLSMPLATLPLGASAKSHWTVISATTLALLVSGATAPAVAMRPVVGGLAHSEIGSRTGLRRRLSFGARQRRADQRSAPQPLFLARRRLVVLIEAGRRRDDVIRDRRERLWLVKVLARLKNGRGVRRGYCQHWR
jgi:hypothetical protein